MNFFNRENRNPSSPANNARPVSRRRRPRGRVVAESLEARTMFGGGYWPEPGVAAPPPPAPTGYTGVGYVGGGGRDWTG